MAKIAVGGLYQFQTGDIVDADVAPQGGALNPIFETIRVALNDTDTRVDAMYTKAEVDALLIAIQAGQVVPGSVTNASLATDVKVGSLASLTTTNKATITAALNETFAKANAAISPTNNTLIADLIISKANPFLQLKSTGVIAGDSVVGIDMKNASNVSYWKTQTTALASLGPQDLQFLNASGTAVAKLDQAGKLTVTNPTAAGHAATKDYVDGQVSFIENYLLGGVEFSLAFGPLHYKDGEEWLPVGQIEELHAFPNIGVGTPSGYTPIGGVTSITTDGTRYIYAMAANNTNAFYRLDTQSPTAWTAMANLPAVVPAGCIAYVGNNKILAFSSSGVVYAYNISGNTWSTDLASAGPGVTNGGCCAWDGADAVYVSRGTTAGLTRYNITAKTVTTLLTPPATSTYGSTAIYDGGDAIWVTKGQTSTGSPLLWYSISANSWHVIYEPDNYDEPSTTYYLGNEAAIWRFAGSKKVYVSGYDENSVTIFDRDFKLGTLHFERTLNLGPSPMAVTIGDVVYVLVTAGGTNNSQFALSAGALVKNIGKLLP